MSDYIVLSSNASLNTFPNNTQSHFSVELAREIPGGSEYLVGLKEIQYESSYYNIDVTSTLTIGRFNDDTELHDHVHVNYTPGLYPSANALIDSFNEKLKKYDNKFDDIQFYYLKYNGHMLIQTEGAVAITFSGDLIDILGLRKLKERQTVGKWMVHWIEAEISLYYIEKIPQKTLLEVPFPCDITRDRHTMFIYSDIVEMSRVGDTLAPILRTVPLKWKSQDIVSHEFKKTYYFPLAKKHIRTIEIALRDGKGLPINFNDGIVTLILEIIRK
jgi:hypothetical protein